jgi:hypothetical protein
MQKETGQVNILSDTKPRPDDIGGRLNEVAFLTDAPPLAGKGHGCHVLAYNLISHLKPFIKVVITRRMRRSLTREEIKNAAGVETLFYPDLLFFPQRFEGIKSRIELLLVRAAASRITRRLKETGVKRIFACCGADPWFLLVIKEFQLATGLPVDIYLVDDFESSAILNGNPALAEKSVSWEREILPQASRVFAISKGFCERIESRIGIKATWLPIPIPLRDGRIQYRPYKDQHNAGNTLNIAYLGAINPLYTGSIRDLLNVIKSIYNPDYRNFRLTIMSYTDEKIAIKELGEMPHCSYLSGLPIEECRKRLEDAWLIFMPYTFEKEHSTMVSTSFPSRLAETISRGRPLLVYGPSYASLPRYFREQNASICVTERDLLAEALNSAGDYDNPHTIAVYERLVRENHSPEALAKILGLS